MFVFCIIFNYILGAICALDQVHIQENGNYPEKKSNILDSNEKDSEEFMLTKLLSIHMNGGYEHINPDLKEVIRSQLNPDLLKNIPTQAQSLPKGESKIHKTSHEPVHDETSGNVFKRNVLGDELTEENLDSFIQELSSFYSDFTKTCRSLVGVEKTPFCNQQEETDETIPKSCKEIQQNGQNISGIYEIQPNTSEKPFTVLCDMETMDGGWTHIQRRLDGSQDFNLGWREYKFGFGNLNGEFWLGLENIHILTSSNVNELLIEIVDRDGEKKHAHYKAFAIGSEKEGFPLKTLSGYSGDAGDSLTYHLDAKFSTKDYDQDTDQNSCAVRWNAAWWFKSCFDSSLNGKFVNLDLPEQNKYQGLHWKTFRDVKYCHAKARMLIRPI